jgi:hypothetical protein
MALTNFRSAYLPYCLHRISGNLYAILNREYKPVGQVESDLADYTKHAVKLNRVGPALASKLSFKGSNDVENIYLYNDSCCPDRSDNDGRNYFARLSLLMRLRVEPQIPT